MEQDKYNGSKIISQQPMKTVEPITVDFRPYAKLGKSNGKIQSRICDLLFRLVQTDDPAK